ATGDLTGAESLYERALRIRQRALGPEHLDVAKTMENYAALLRQMQRKSEAVELEARAKAINSTHARKFNSTH
ncbi:MAG: tetratricopeptide repeat protein, partial [Nitrospirota bacterium]